MSDKSSTLILRDLHKSYDDIEVLRGLDLSVDEGEFVSLVGPSGCGKTTTLNIIAGFEDPTSGVLMLDGTSMIGVPPHRRGLGMVFQNHALFPHMTIAENVAFGLKMQKRPAQEILERVQNTLDMVRLLHLAERYPRQLSGGQQQRVGIARALTVRPKLILMDEPLSSLDAKLRREMQVELRRIQQEVGITAVYVTHDQEEALTMSDRLVLLNGGRIEQAAAPETVYKSPASEFAATFIGESSIFDARVVEQTGGLASVEFSDGQKTGTNWLDWMCPEMLLRIAVRPDRVIMRPAEGPGRHLVLGRSFVGSVLRYEVDFGRDRVLKVQVPADTDFRPEEGDLVDIQVHPEDWMVFAKGATT